MTTIYKAKAELVHDWPALKVYHRKSRKFDEREEYIEIDHDDILHSNHTGGIAGRTYQADSVFSYAIRHGDCPQKLYKRALEFGHDIYWINQDGSIISDCSTPSREAVAIRPGDIVRFQGRFFKIAVADNDNLKLEPVNV